MCAPHMATLACYKSVQAIGVRQIQKSKIDYCKLYTKMSDTKTHSRTRKSRGAGRVSRPVARMYNEMYYKTSWTSATIASGTTGVIATTVAPTIQNSHEYSTLSGIFTEIKLISCVMSLAPIAYATNTAGGRITVGTNMLMNATTFTLPASFTDVSNLTRRADYSTGAVRIWQYRMAVPKSLEYFNIANDAPTLVAPFGGSPGVIQVYGNGFPNSVSYFQVTVECRYHLRGRQ